MPNIFLISFIIYALACFTIHILFNYNNTGASMSSSIISQSPVFNGSFVVTHSDGTQVPCHNLSTAKVVAGQTVTTDSLAKFPEQITVEEYYGCVLGGLGRYTPAITWTITGRVERVHNWSTAQTIVKDNEKLRAAMS